MIENLLLIAHLVMAVALVVLVLLQQGKGAQAGAAFGGGGGSSQSLFGARGSANFLTRTTAVIATVFFVTTLTLAYMYANRSTGTSVVSGSVVEQVEEQAAEDTDVPMVPADAGDESTKAPQGDVPVVPE